MQVNKHAELVMAKGFVFMDTAGYDPVSATGRIASGANLIAVLPDYRMRIDVRCQS